MQRLTIFSIFDSKAQAYLQPFFSNNVETAKREFATAVNGEGQFNKYTEDYSMFLLGTFDQDDGTFILESAPIHCANAITLKQIQPFEIATAEPHSITELRDASRKIIKETTPQ